MLIGFVLIAIGYLSYRVISPIVIALDKRKERNAIL
jgi:hypothetical protein